MNVRHRSGFTIVELLIVIVILAILATMTIIAFTGISDRAQESAVLSDMKSSSTAIKILGVDKGEAPSTAQLATNSSVIATSVSAKLSFLAYCSNGQSYVLFAKTDKHSYVASNAQTPQRNDGSTAESECTNIGVVKSGTSPADIVYPKTTFCASEGQTCTVSAPKKILYGANGRMNTATMNSSFGCSGIPGPYGYDPAPGTVKACYIVDF